MATDMFYGATPELFRKADELRRMLTPAEKIVWKALRANQLEGFRFKSQHPLSHFIADFYSHKARLVVEIDGGIHQEREQMEYDKGRTRLMEELGITVLRFSNEDVFHHLPSVLDRIRSFLRVRQPDLSPDLAPSPDLLLAPDSPPTP
ncbi:endonuclease domain-containing protein [Larkinella sp. GY13]|uniref:endonuclease domain-containing protein n=1 Tax=Larkinella sp. GY13 TaxID=3453720 RepID=UPI003EEF0F70